MESLTIQSKDDAKKKLTKEERMAARQAPKVMIYLERLQ